MKKISFLFALIFAGCYSTSIVNNVDIQNVNFDNIKKGTIAVFSGGMNSTRSSGISYGSSENSGISDDKTRANIVESLTDYFHSTIATVTIVNDETPLPKAYIGEINLNQKEEMDKFLNNVKADYAFIVSAVKQDLQSRVPNVIGEVDNNIIIVFELWDIKSKSILLDYEVTNKGWINMNGTLQTAVEFIKKNGNTKL